MSDDELRELAVRVRILENQVTRLITVVEGLLLRASGEGTSRAEAVERGD